jgi:uncharacterized membrane protein
MTAKEWLEILEVKVKVLPKDERDGIMSYYSEMIADGIESGTSEEEFINSLGNPNDVANKILAENGINYTNDEQNSGADDEDVQPTTKFTNVKALPTWAVLLIGFFGIVVGIPIIATVAGAVISLLVTFWACFGAFTFSTGACAIGVFVSIIMGITGTVQSGWALVGACILAVGVTALLTVGFWYISIYTTKLIAFIFKKLKGGKHA